MVRVPLLEIERSGGEILRRFPPALDIEQDQAVDMQSPPVLSRGSAIRAYRIRIKFRG